MPEYKTPGVYINEVAAFPNSAVVVETAVPAFIGYTFKAERNGNSLIGLPTRINSFAEYVESFGGAFSPKFKIEEDKVHPPGASSIKIGAATINVSFEAHNELYFYNSIRLFYANGGSSCIILAVDTYGDKQNGLEVKASDFTKAGGPLEILKKTQEPTLIVIPDVVKLNEEAYAVYPQVLVHCSSMQDRFAIFDLQKHDETLNPEEVAADFRSRIGDHFLNYGAAYYPWLNTNVVDDDELTFENLPDTLSDYLEDGEPKKICQDYAVEFAGLKYLIKQRESQVKQSDYAFPDQLISLKKNHHLALKSASSNYKAILQHARFLANQLPPSAAIAGMYTMVDSTRGVWKAPANCSLNEVVSPIVNISNEAQVFFNVDPETGKSINVIRPFEGLGTLVWGARTLDGNSDDWKYINVRRTLIMIEQSIKAATRAYVFEPNDANTWITVKSMIDNFLFNLWKQGALAGAVPEQAYDVQIGLGSTMTANDILDGKMLVCVKVAIVRPAEFIVITFQQQLQQS
ncbi:phage tail sheath C-terminal domain-containing protein [Pedobacter sp. BMA]|uniref:phage tail sheath family protein n=1 Tax=Pedobacter sp. BMA TaxID=1663685 RepID=UPI00064ACE02|nr:phage tail sheath C-terminal domain-containing protein [Pedobacter sp. BMA]KLT64447.1 phage tail sheath protein [Pedobacter sp. BMA]